MSKIVAWFLGLGKIAQIAVVTPLVLVPTLAAGAFVHGLVTQDQPPVVLNSPSQTPTSTCVTENLESNTATCFPPSPTETSSISPTASSTTTQATSKAKATATPASGSTATSTSNTTSSTSSNTTTSSTSTPTATPTPTAAPASPPVIKNLGVSFAAYDSQTGRAGAFDFLKLQSKPFVDFGDSGTEPTFTYRTAEDADVTAIAEGYVYRVEYQSTYSDYSILASTAQGDLTWTIDYDHIISPAVSVGDHITSGQRLGLVGTHSDIGIGRVEIQVFGGPGSGTPTSYCPWTYFDSGLIASYKAKLQKLMDDYEAYMYNTNIYNPSDYTSSGHLGCKASTVAG